MGGTTGYLAIYSNCSTELDMIECRLGMNADSAYSRHGNDAFCYSGCKRVLWKSMLWSALISTVCETQSEEK
jgi:hypothetical protein